MTTKLRSRMNNGQFKTVAEMKASTTLKIGEFVTVENYTATNNSGVLHFEIVAAATGTDDGGRYIDCTASTVQAKQIFKDGVVSVKAFGAEGDGVIDDTAAIQKAINSLLKVYIPSGTFGITTPLIVPSRSYIYGAGIGKTIIDSSVIGDSTFKCDTDAVYITIRDLTMTGNNLTGASGNGHAIGFVDPISTGGTFAPQNCLLENIEIKYFKGQDIRTTDVATTIMAAGVCMYNTLQNICRNVHISQCGHGFYMSTTQNCRIESCVVANVTKFALIAYNNENLIVSECDLVDAGDGVVDVGYPTTAYGWGSGVILSYLNNSFVLKNSKVKNNRQGTSLIRSFQSTNDNYEGNWIRADALTDSPHQAIYAQSAYGLKIRNNEFAPSTTAFTATQKYKQIEVYNTQTNDTNTVEITGNVFGDVSGMNIEYNIKIYGNANTRSFRTTIKNNVFGYNNGRSSASVVDADIVLDTCAIYSSDISNNLHIASTNVTRTVGVFGNNIKDDRNVVGPSHFSSNGGTITTQYSGISQSLLYGTATYNPPSLADGTRATTTVTVTGVTLTAPNVQLIVDVGFSKDILGVNMWGYVSADNTVTVVFENRTGGVVDIASGAIYVQVRKYGVSP